MEATQKEIFAIQAKHLEEWRGKLTDDCFRALEFKMLEENSKIYEGVSPYRIFRGDSMTTFVRNWHP